MRMGQGVRTGLGHGASPVSYRHNFLVIYMYNENNINNDAAHLKSPKNQNRRAALGRKAMKLLWGGGGASTSLRSTNPRP